MTGKPLGGHLQVWLNADACFGRQHNRTIDKTGEWLTQCFAQRVLVDIDLKYASPPTAASK